MSVLLHDVEGKFDGSGMGANYEKGENAKKSVFKIYVWIYKDRKKEEGD